MDIKQTLEQIGLKDKEAVVYLTMLELGEATVLEIAKKSGIKRPTTYVILNTLSEKGLVSRVLKGRRTFYGVDHPRKLIADTELKLRYLKESVPFLENLMIKRDLGPKIKIYEGLQQLDLAYDESFLVEGEVLYMSTIRYSEQLFPRTIKKLEYMKDNPKFSTRELVDDSPAGRDYRDRAASTNRQIRFIASKFMPFEIDIGIFNKTVLITSVKQQLFTVALESVDIAQAFRSLFEAMWQLSAE